MIKETDTISCKVIIFFTFNANQNGSRDIRKAIIFAQSDTRSTKKRKYLPIDP